MHVFLSFHVPGTLSWTLHLCRFAVGRLDHVTNPSVLYGDVLSPTLLRGFGSWNKWRKRRRGEGKKNVLRDGDVDRGIGDH